ncbi:MAG TPA: response regulator [Acidimicrobiales bacterium]|nr:response regulator [Acidimicrobiales bacterium]
MSAPATGRAPVLVVDDDEDIRTSVADILAGQGYEVRTADDGDEALRLIGQEPFAVLVLDVRMPRRDGLAVLDALEHPPPVVLMSAHSLDREAKGRLRPKVSTFLKKPFPPRLLIEQIAGIVSGAGGTQ